MWLEFYKINTWQCVPLCFLQVSLDQIMIHVKQTKTDLVEDHVQFVAHRNRLLAGLTELSQCCLLMGNNNEIVQRTNRKTYIVSKTSKTKLSV